MASHGVTISIPLQAGAERRQAERFVASMPVRIDGSEGMTQDLSSTGLSFVAEHAYEPGARVTVVIEYLLDGHRYPLECEAEVVRVQPGEGGYIVGARLVPQSRLPEVAVESAEAVSPDPAVPRMRLRAID